MLIAVGEIWLIREMNEHRSSQEGYYWPLNYADMASQRLRPLLSIPLLEQCAVLGETIFFLVGRMPHHLRRSFSFALDKSKVRRLGAGMAPGCSRV